ncbi:hypothetical protein [Methylobacterium trifolii]|uniref:Uncharacterized protein n=1 Tax=Methylobacterium trifolii TaxID=1003092 RepID=A0ABQ4U3J3_9HYPH|nr:hypothetical protein [Methylobacterium trifolii]GJE61764.1 hypothetical protein MPOCJGCO_3890 [Methylobacterium trifolii]
MRELDPAWITVRATRDDVHPGDQAEPNIFRAGVSTSDEDILQQAADPRWLPHISQSIIAWSITASEILAVVEHDCEAATTTLMVMPWLEMRVRPTDRADGEMQLPFNCHAGHDARSIFAILEQVRLRERSRIP